MELEILLRAERREDDVNRARYGSDSKEEVGCRDERVKISARLDGRRQVAVIDERRSNGNVARQGQGLDLAGHFIFNVGVDCALPLDLDDIDAAFALQEKIDLASLFARRRQLAPRRGGLEENSVKAELPKQQGDVIEDQVLELKPENGIPSGKGIKRAEPESVLVDYRLVRTDVAQVEPRVIVGNPIADAFGGFPRRRIDSGVLGDEPGRFQLGEVAADDASAFDLQGVGDFGKGQRCVSKSAQHLVLVDGILAEDGVEDLG